MSVLHRRLFLLPLHSTMRKLWSILLFVMLCNVASLVARDSMHEVLTADDIQCFIGEQEEHTLNNSYPTYSLHQSETISVVTARTSASEGNTAKHSVSAHNKSYLTERSGWLCSKAYITSHKEPFAHLFSRIKDHYIYALRHIII